MAITKVSELGDTIPTIIEEARFTEQFTAIMRGLCWNLKKPKGSTINVPYFGEVTAHVLTEAIDMVSSETMEDTNVEITMNEVGLKIILTDNVIEDDQEDLKRAAGRIIGEAYEKKRDQDLLAQLDDGTVSIPGTGAALTMGVIAAGRAILAGNATSSGGPAPQPYVVVLHPYQYLDIVDVVTPVLPAAGTMNVGGSALFDDILRNYSRGRLFGMPIVEDGNISINTTPDAKGGIFSTGRGGSIIYGTAREPTLEPERDASLRAWEMNYVGRYGVGEYLAGWIVELMTDATTPA